MVSYRMPSKTRTVVSIIACVALFALIAFVVTTRLRTSEASAIPSNSDLTALAELSTTSTQGIPIDATSTKMISLPIVVYHIVRPSYPSDDAKVRALAQTPEIFDAEMQYLTTAGYHVVTFADLEDYYDHGKSLPQNPIILSFDDGWGDQFAYAFPILQKYHYTATFFVFTNAIGRPGFLTWDNLQTLIAAGMTIGSHSESHPFLTRITEQAKLWNEISGSKTILENRLGVTVNEFAYPFGQYNPAIVALVQKAGYLSARGDFLSGKQTADHMFELSALNAGTTLASFERQFPQR